MGIIGFETKDIARQVEGSDLPAPIGENLIGPYGTRYDLVHVLRRLVLAIDLCVAAVGHRGAYQVDRVAERAAGYLRPSCHIVRGSAGETSADCILCQHGLTSRRM
jgi:hypothetical protein